MKIDLTIKNLGRLEKGNISIRPLTILTGENGSGKSFFTKSLYSIFSVINKNLLHTQLLEDIKVIEFLLRVYLEQITFLSEEDKISIGKSLQRILELKEELVQASKEDISFYLTYIKSISANMTYIHNEFKIYIESVKKKKTKFKSIRTSAARINIKIVDLISTMEESNDSYADLLESHLKTELIENFQITDLAELITFDKNKCEIASDLFAIRLNKSDIEFSLQHEFINEVSSLSRVVFFESPAYWKVREALIEAKSHSVTSDLTGVPKYFYDLDKILRTKSVNNSVEITDLANNLQTAVGGSFLYQNGSFTFRDEVGNEIPKNLVSFGMTNLGMVHTLLSNNVINKGSFVFFDEPETNLHPKWQVLLMQTLIELAKHDINVVIATHSIDMLKALEVGLKKEDDINKMVSVNYFNNEGGLHKFESNNLLEQITESREILSSSYEQLYFEDALSD